MKSEVFNRFGGYRWKDRFNHEAFLKLDNFNRSGLYDSFVLQRAMEAMYILDVSMRAMKSLNSGCASSSIAFTHGANIFGKIRWKVWHNEFESINESSEEISNRSSQWCFRQPLINLSPRKLESIVKRSKCAWVISKLTEEEGHMFSFMNGEEGRIWVWDTDMASVYPTRTTSTLSMMSLSQLHHYIKLHNNPEFDTHPIIYQFVDRVRGR